MRLKVLHLASGDLWAGAEVQLYFLISELVKLDNIEVGIILLNHGELEQKLRQLGINVTVFDEKKNSFLKILISTIKYIRRYKPVIIHTHRYKENILGSISSLFSKNCYSLRTVHGSDENTEFNLISKKTLYQKLDELSGKYIQKKIVAVSQDLNNKLLKYYPSNLLVIIENGVSINNIESRAQIKSECFEHKSHINIAIVGRCVAVKRMDVFLKIAEQLNNQSPGVFHFHIVGDGPEMRNIENLQQTLELQAIVSLHGFIKDPIPLLKHMNILLITSDHEGLPINLLEAICLRVPIISHQVGGIPKALGHGKYGTLISSQDPLHYIEKIIDYSQNPDEYKKKAELAYQNLHDQYSSEKISKLYIDLYNSLF